MKTTPITEAYIHFPKNDDVRPYWVLPRNPLWSEQDRICLGQEGDSAIVQFHVAVHKVRDTGHFGVFNYFSRHGHRATYGMEDIELHADFMTLEEALGEAQTVTESYRELVASIREEYDSEATQELAIRR